MGYAIPVEPGVGLDLTRIEPKQDSGLTREDGEARLAALAAELAELQELLYAAGDHALLVILQGMDTSGKDGTVRAVFSDVSLTGCQVIGFKPPSEEERAHDFLWRIHQKTPRLGMIGIFNRSHYEDVLVVRVRGLAPESVWRPRYEQINAFEALLTQTGTIVAKFFLHISKEEQERRLRAREEDVTKAWKLAVGDWEERTHWDDYQATYAEALARCGTPVAPWWIVPADRKWFRNLAVAEALVETLRPYRDGWIAMLEARGARELAKIRALRGEG